MQKKEYDSVGLPLPFEWEVNSANMFDGTQYHTVTLRMLGASSDRDTGGGTLVTYFNDVFKGTILYENTFVGELPFMIETGGKKYYSSNGLCAPQESTQILPIYKESLKFAGKSEYATSHDIERYMFWALYRQ